MLAATHAAVTSGSGSSKGVTFVRETHAQIEANTCRTADEPGDLASPCESSQREGQLVCTG